MNKTPHPLFAFSFIFVLIIIWGLSWPFMKLALHYTSPLWLGTLRLAIGATCLFALLLAQGKLRLPTRADLPIIASVGLLQAGLFNAFVGMGLLHVAAGRSVILAYTTPLWVTPIAVFLFKEPLPWLKVIGLLSGLAGILFLFNPAQFDWHNHQAVLGNGLLLLAAISWAICIIHSRHNRRHLSTLQLLPWQLLIGTLLLFFCSLYWESDIPTRWTPQFLILLAFIGFIATALGYWMVLEVSHRLPSVTTSLCLLGVPVAGLLFSHVLLNEPIYFNMIISMVLIIVGLIFVILCKH